VVVIHPVAVALLLKHFIRMMSFAEMSADGIYAKSPLVFSSIRKDNAKLDIQR